MAIPRRNLAFLLCALPFLRPPGRPGMPLIRGCAATSISGNASGAPQ
jgi:hypothetical protein